MSPQTVHTQAPGQQSAEAADAELNRAILAGDLLDAFERFYAEDVSMQEGEATPTIGKDANREREKQFVSSVEQVHEVKLLGSCASDDISYSEWYFDVSFKGGQRAQFAQVAARRWRDGKVVHERFYRGQS
jgi:ketosteroid isomerase-like protein